MKGNSWACEPLTDWPNWAAARSSRLAQAPTLIPIYGHRYLPAGNGTHGHPVLSVYQTDIIFYGTDLADYMVDS